MIRRAKSFRFLSLGKQKIYNWVEKIFCKIWGKLPIGFLGKPILNINSEVKLNQNPAKKRNVSFFRYKAGFIR